MTEEQKLMDEAVVENTAKESASEDTPRAKEWRLPMLFAPAACPHAKWGDVYFIPSRPGIHEDYIPVQRCLACNKMERV